MFPDCARLQLEQRLLRRLGAGECVADGARNILRAVSGGDADRLTRRDIARHLHHAIGAGQRGIHAGQQGIGAGRNAAAGRDRHRHAGRERAGVGHPTGAGHPGGHDQAGIVGIGEVGIVGRDVRLIARHQCVDLPAVGILRHDRAGHEVLLRGGEDIAGAAGAGHVLGGIDVAAAAQVEHRILLRRDAGAVDADRLRGRRRQHLRQVAEVGAGDALIPGDAVDRDAVRDDEADGRDRGQAAGSQGDSLGGDERHSAAAKDPRHPRRDLACALQAEHDAAERRPQRAALRDVLRAEHDCAAGGQRRMRGAVLRDADGVEAIERAERRHQELGVADRIDLGRVERQVAGDEQRAPEHLHLIRRVDKTVVVRQEADGSGAGEIHVAGIADTDPPLEIDPLGGDVELAVAERGRRKRGAAGLVADHPNIAGFKIDRGGADIRNARTVRRQQIRARIDGRQVAAAALDVDGCEAGGQQATAFRQQHEVAQACGQRQRAGDRDIDRAGEGDGRRRVQGHGIEAAVVQRVHADEGAMRGRDERRQRR